MRFGSLFAGVGGFDLGFERAGMTCAWQVEIDPYCRKVLEKHWPNVRRHDDARTFPPAGDWSVDVICGGFPCQDISLANAGGLGIDGPRSGLWKDFARIVRVIRPRIVVVENSPGLLVRGMGRVLGDLAACGFDAEWTVLPAAAFGAPHIRERLFIVAHAKGKRRRARWPRRPSGDRERAPEQTHWTPVFDAASVETWDDSGLRATGWRMQEPGIRCGFTGRPWPTEPALGRVAHGVPSGLVRTSKLGNAVVPQVAEFIARRILAAEHKQWGWE